jgi:hypothetical protein
MNIHPLSRRLPLHQAIALVLLPSLILCAAPAVQAQDRAELDRTRIVGNRELPKVTYIVPWKKPVPDELTPKPMRSVLDDALLPIDPEVHRRQVAYHAAIHRPVSKPTPTPTTTPAPQPEKKP